MSPCGSGRTIFTSHNRASHSVPLLPSSQNYCSYFYPQKLSSVPLNLASFRIIHLSYRHVSFISFYQILSSHSFYYFDHLASVLNLKILVNIFIGKIDRVGHFGESKVQENLTKSDTGSAHFTKNKIFYPPDPPASPPPGNRKWRFRYIYTSRVSSFNRSRNIRGLRKFHVSDVTRSTPFDLILHFC